MAAAAPYSHATPQPDPVHAASGWTSIGQLVPLSVSPAVMPTVPSSPTGVPFTVPQQAPKESSYQET